MAPKQYNFSSIRKGKTKTDRRKTHKLNFKLNLIEQLLDGRKLFFFFWETKDGHKLATDMIFSILISVEIKFSNNSVADVYQNTFMLKRFLYLKCISLISICI